MADSKLDESKVDDKGHDIYESSLIFVYVFLIIYLFNKFVICEI